MVPRAPVARIVRCPLLIPARSFRFPTSTTFRVSRKALATTTTMMTDIDASIYWRGAKLVGTTVVGRSGQSYLVEISGAEVPELHHLLLASSGDEKYILKDLQPSSFDDIVATYQETAGFAHVRQLHDTIPQWAALVFRYRTLNLLEILEHKVPVDRKRVLKDALRGILELHKRHIFHTRISPTNILVELNEDRSVQRVDIADLEEALEVPPNMIATGEEKGHPWWRSLEAHVGGPMSLPSDIFSFGATCICAILGEYTFTISDENKFKDGSRLATYRKVVAANRQVAHFGDNGGLDGFIEYLTEFMEAESIRAALEKSPLSPSPFSKRKDVDPVFKNLIAGLMNLDPRKRLTAQEALEHEWFQDA